MAPVRRRIVGASAGVTAGAFARGVGRIKTKVLQRGLWCLLYNNNSRVVVSQKLRQTCVASCLVLRRDPMTKLVLQAKLRERCVLRCERLLALSVRGLAVTGLHSPSSPTWC
jgi:hypothetical protein